VVPPAEAAAPRLVEFPNPNIAQAYGYRDFEKYRCRVKGVMRFNWFGTPGSAPSACN